MRKVSLAILVILATSAITVADEVLWEQYADADLTAAGWTQDVSGSGAAFTTGTETNGTKYWQVADTSTSGRGTWLLNGSPATGLNYGNTRGPDSIGWTLTAKMKVESVDNIYAVTLWLGDGVNRWCLGFTQTGVSYLGKSDFVSLATTTTNDDYHVYQMIYSGGSSGTLTVYKDGTELGSFSTSDVYNAFYQYRVDFGSTTTGSTGTSRWSYITLETGQHVVPEPATLGLISLGGGVMLLRCRRK